jgi:predicted phosphodiesterase
MTGGTQVRIAAVSDIHGNLPALEAVVADIARHHVDQVVNLGDCLSGPLWPAETADWLIELGWPTLAGNHERQMLGPGAATLDNGDGFAASSISAAHRDWLKGLPPAMSLGDDLFLCHGTPDNDDGYWLHRGRPGAMRKATPDEIIPHATSHGLALCGHTHVSRRVILGDGRMIANPGSVGLPAFDDHDLVPDHMGPIIPQACYLIAELNAEGWRVTLRTVAYDIERAARRAEANGRFGWTYTLRTGKRRR